MKTSTKIIVILGILIILGMILFAIDFIRVDNNKAPILCIQVKSYEDGGSIEYIGFGYKVIKYVDLENNKELYKIGTYFMEFNNPFDKDILQGISPTPVPITFSSKSIQTHIYIDSFNSPSVDIIKSLSDLEKYKVKYNDETLYSSFDKYSKSYFSNNVLVIVNIQESSGSNTNKIDRIAKDKAFNRIDIFVKRDVAGIGTADMAMWHLIAEIDKKVFGSTTDIEVLDSTTMYH
jgi:hypothetical protein